MPPLANSHSGRRRTPKTRAVFRGPLLVRGLGWCVLIALAPSIGRAEVRLEMIREDVRSPRPSSSPSEPEDHKGRKPNRDCGHDHYYHNPADSPPGQALGWLVACGIAAPFVAPTAIVGDDYDRELFFQRFPYDQAAGYMDDVPWPGSDRWAARLSTEYGTDFDDLELISARLLMSTTPRWGVDLQMQRFFEQLPGGGHDELWLGDGNLVFRFAQSQHTQWRTGIGLNWLSDQLDTNYGFNFTYGADWFPRRPWVLSATIDWGTLGGAQLFRFRSTAGVLVNRFETYIGYEYLDIDRTRINSFVAGVRVWF